MEIRRRNISFGSFSPYFLRDRAIVNGVHYNKIKRTTELRPGVSFVYATIDKLAVSYIQMKTKFSFCCIV